MSSNAAGVGAGNLLDVHVRGYAEAVRLHLADLGPEVTEDLTDGLEADLAEAVADSVLPVASPGEDVAFDLAAHFGPAAAYAAELRAAAGLPPAGPPFRRRPGLRASATSAARSYAARWRERWRPVTSTPQWADLRALGRDLRPVWWVGRGWVVGSWLNALFGGDTLLLVPTEASDVVLPLFATLISVQWGRGRWLPWRWMPRAVVAVSLFALLVTPTLFDHTRTGVLYGTTGATGYADSYQEGYDDATQAGFTYEGGGTPGDDAVWVDGMQVSNLFAYDANGDPIKDVQIFDDRGRPVRTVPEKLELEAWSVPDAEGVWYFQPALADDGRERWNVYPLRALPEAAMTYGDDGGLAPQVGAQMETMPWPFLKAPTRIVPDDGAPAAPTEDSGPSPTASPDQKDRPEQTGDPNRRDATTRGTAPTAAGVDASASSERG